MHILSAIPDHAISDPVYVPERHTDTQAEGVCALIAIAQETTGEAPGHGGAPALLHRADGSARAAGLSPAAPALSAVPRVQAVGAVPGAQAVGAPPAGRAGPALLDDPLGQAPRTLDGVRAAGEPRPRRRLAGRAGKHRRPPVPPGVGMLAPSAVMGEHPAGPGGARRGLDAELETSLLSAVVTPDAPPRPPARPSPPPGRRLTCAGPMLMTGLGAAATRLLTEPADPDPAARSGPTAAPGPGSPGPSIRFPGPLGRRPGAPSRTRPPARGSAPCSSRSWTWPPT